LKVQIVSDLHCEFHRDFGAEMIASIPDAGDVLVIAGDLLPAKWPEARIGLILCQFRQRWEEVVYVAGNHEAYGLSIDVAESNLRRACQKEGVHFLANEAREVGGLRFFGGTGWFPDRVGDPVAWASRVGMSDFHVIRGIEDDAPASNRLFDERLATGMVANDMAAWFGESPGDRPSVDVVVSHHMPHPACIDPMYAKSALYGYFLADFEHLLPATPLWIHGHTHSPVDTVVGGTRIVCNPRGYPQERPGEYPAVVVDVTPKEPA
jgi:predicted phosphodiesterase